MLHLRQIFLEIICLVNFIETEGGLREVSEFKPEELELKLVPLQGVEFVGKGMLKFGITRDEVWEFFERHFNVDVKEERQKAFNRDDRDRIRPLRGMFVSFRRETDRVEAVEVVDSYEKLEILGKQIFSIPMLQAFRWCLDIDPEAYDDGCVTSSKYGFRIGTDEIDWRKAPAGSAVLFEENCA